MIKAAELGFVSSRSNEETIYFQKAILVGLEVASRKATEQRIAPHRFK